MGSCHLRAGVARADITPPVGITHLPWGAAVHDRAEGIDMELWTTALVVSQGEQVVALVELDLCLLEHRQADEIRSAVVRSCGIPFERVLVSCTHNHSGPSIGSSWITAGGELIPGYVEMLRDRVAGAVWEALRCQRPARVGGGSGTSAINVNRRLRLPDGRVVVGRNWDGFVDRQVQVVRVDDLDECPIATLVNFQAHPTIMAFTNRLITPDYPGPTRRTVEREVGGLCLFLQGAGGNAQAVLSFSSRPEDYRSSGHVLGLEAARVSLETRTRPRRERLVDVVESGAALGIFVDEPTGEAENTLGMASRQVRLPLRERGPIPALSAEARRQAADLQALKDHGATEEAIRDQAYRAKRATMALEFAHRYDGSSEVTIELQAIRLGAIALLGIPGEPFMELGWAIKERSPFAQTLVCGYVNGYQGYMPTREAYAQGGYEPEWGTAYQAGAGETTVEESLRLLHELHALGSAPTA